MNVACKEVSHKSVYHKNNQKPSFRILIMQSLI